MTEPAASPEQSQSRMVAHWESRCTTPLTDGDIVTISGYAGRFRVRCVPAEYGTRAYELVPLTDTDKV